jgi:hypothetical protein
MDQSYVSIAGMWAASSDQDNIWISPESKYVPQVRSLPATYPILSLLTLSTYNRGTIITIAGGTIFNAGAEGGDPNKGMCNGIVINAGIGCTFPGDTASYLVTHVAISRSPSGICSNQDE